MKCRPTEEIREDGSTWLGPIPESWELVPSNWLFREGTERARPDDQHLSATQKYGVIPLADFERLEGRRVTHAFENLEQRKHVETDDFVISMRSFEGGIERVMAPGCVRSSYIVLHAAPTVHTGFFSYLFKSSAYIQGLQSTSTFVRDGQDLNYGNFRKLKLPRPSVSEQRKIAAYLDRATARIDTLIAKKTRFVELLREKRQALITRAITKGIDPKAPLINSGVEWLGDVPAHWSVKRIKRDTPVMRGASPRPIDDPKYFDDDGEYGWVRIADVTESGGQLRSTAQKLSSLGASLSVKLSPGSLFVSIAGSVGKACITDIKACIHDGFVYFPHLTINPRFLFRVFEAGQCFVGLGKRGTQLNLNSDTVGSIKIALPPPHETEEILSFLDFAICRIDTLLAKTERSIELLRERRRALITAAVTGKILVRATSTGAAA